MAQHGLGDKTYGLLQVPSQWIILHTSQVLPISTSKSCIVYICICVLRFLWNHLIFYFMYIFKMENAIKEEKYKWDLFVSENVGIAL